MVELIFDTKSDHSYVWFDLFSLFEATFRPRYVGSYSLFLTLYLAIAMFDKVTFSLRLCISPQLCFAVRVSYHDAIFCVSSVSMRLFSFRRYICP